MTLCQDKTEGNRMWDGTECPLLMCDKIPGYLKGSVPWLIEIHKQENEELVLNNTLVSAGIGS